MGAILSCAEERERRRSLEVAIDAVRGGKLVVTPTDTLYGIGADAFNRQAVADLLAAKRRGPDYPVPVLVGSWSTIAGLVSRQTDEMTALVKAFWPGGLSLVVEQAPSLPWDLGDSRGTVMLRMPNHPVALQLLREVGPMAVSSANLHGQQPPTSAQAARQQLGDAVEVYLDAGPAQLGEASTIVDLAHGRPRVLRAGAVATADVARVLGVAAEELERD